MDSGEDQILLITGKRHWRYLSRRHYLEATGRREWKFEVARRCFAFALLQRGPCPSYASMKGAHPFHNPRSNPTLFGTVLLLFTNSALVAQHCLCGGEGGLRTYGHG
jgi:hypothetical protein